MADNGLVLTEQEKNVLTKFKVLTEDIHKPDYSDSFYLRWLRAREFDIDKAGAMLRKCLEWRKEVGADTIVDTYEPPEVLRKYYPGAGVVGYDRKGDGFTIFPAGNIDAKGILRCVTKEEIIKYVCVYRSEKIAASFREQSKKIGRLVEKITIIEDLDNFGMKHLMCRPAMEIFAELARVYEANYPESLDKFLIINAPKIVSLAIAFVRPFLNENTANKIKIYGRADGWKEALLKDIDPSELPVHYGGTRVDENGDPKCSALFSSGGEVPESYYVR